MPGWQRKKHRAPATAAKQARAAAAEEAAEKSKQSELLTRAEMMHWEEEFGSLGRGTVAVAAFLASGELPAPAHDDDDDLLPPRRPFERKRAVSLPMRRFDGGEFGGGIDFVPSPARPTSLVVDDFSPPISPTPGGLDAYLAARQVFPSKTPVKDRNRRFSAPLLSSLRNELPAIDSEDGHGAHVEPTTVMVEDPSDIEEPVEIDYTEDYFGWGATHEEVSTRATPAFAASTPPDELDILEAALDDLSDWGAAYEAASTDRAPDALLPTPTPMPKPSPSEPATREVIAAELPRPSPHRRLSAPVASPLRHELPIARSEDGCGGSTPIERPVDFGEDDSDSVPLGLIHPDAVIASKAASPTLLEPTRPNSIAWPSRPRFHIPRGSVADSTALRPRLADNRRHSTLGFGEIQDRSASVIGHRDDAERILMGWKAPVPAPEAQHDSSSVTNPHFLPYRLSAKPESRASPYFLKSKLDPSTVTNPHFLPQHKLRKPTPSAFPSTVRPRPKSLAFPSLSAPVIPRVSTLAPANTFRSPTPFDFSPTMKRNTFIEISQNIGQNTVRGTHEKPARLDYSPAKERIVVGDWSAKLTPKLKPKPTPRIMELTELEERHKRKLKQMQDPVVKSVKQHEDLFIAKSAYAQRQQLEAAEQRKHDRAREGRRRSFATLSILPRAQVQPSLNSPSSPTEFATMKRMSAAPRSASSPNFGATGPRPEPAASMGGRRGSMMSVEKVAMWQGGSPARPAQAVLRKSPPASQHPSQAPSASEAPTIKPKSKLDWLGY